MTRIRLSGCLPIQIALEQTDLKLVIYLPDWVWLAGQRWTGACVSRPQAEASELHNCTKYCRKLSALSTATWIREKGLCWQFNSVEFLDCPYCDMHWSAKSWIEQTFLHVSSRTFLSSIWGMLNFHSAIKFSLNKQRHHFLCLPWFLSSAVHCIWWSIFVPMPGE